MISRFYSLKVGGSMPLSEVNVNFKNKTYTDFWREDKNKLMPKR